MPRLKRDTRVRGAVTLEAFLREHSITNAAASEALGVSDVSVHMWIRGKVRPREDQREKIERWTGGAVLSESWRSEKERQDLASVRPFATGTEG